MDPEERVAFILDRFHQDLARHYPSVHFTGAVLRAIKALAIACYELGQHDAHHTQTLRAPDPRAAGRYLIINKEGADDDSSEGSD